MLSTLSLAATAGLLSTLHCWGMCGGIVAALALGAPAARRAHPARSLLLAFAYNGGRLLSYCALGALSALIVLPAGAGLWGYRVLQMLGLVALVAAGLRLGGWFVGVGWLERAGLGVWRHISPLTRHFLPIDRVTRALPAGLLWGLLPCGLVYAMLPVAAAGGGVAMGALTMAAFGAGTLPGMVLAGAASSTLAGFKPGPGLRRFAGASLIAMACVWFGLQWLGSTHDHAAHAGHAGHTGHLEHVAPAGASTEDPHAAHRHPPAAPSPDDPHAGHAGMHHAPGDDGGTGTAPR